MVHLLGAVDEEISPDSNRQDPVSQCAPIEEAVYHVLFWQDAKMHFADPESTAHLTAFAGFANQVDQISGIDGAVTEPHAGTHRRPDACVFE